MLRLNRTNIITLTPVLVISPLYFREAAVVVIDAIGEWHTMTIWHAVDNHLKLIKAVNYPSSLGLLYSCFTKRCGLRTNDEEFILMGMAAFGEPIYADRIENDFIGDDLFFSRGIALRALGITYQVRELKIWPLVSKSLPRSAY